MVRMSATSAGLSRGVGRPHHPQPGKDDGSRTRYCPQAGHENGQDGRAVEAARAVVVDGTHRMRGRARSAPTRVSCKSRGSPRE